MRRAAALASAHWATVGSGLRSDFVYVNAEGIRLTRDEYLAFVRDAWLYLAGQTAPKR